MIYQGNIIDRAPYDLSRFVADHAFNVATVLIIAWAVAHVMVWLRD
jgi:hypothetical protein